MHLLLQVYGGTIHMHTTVETLPVCVGGGKSRSGSFVGLCGWVIYFAPAQTKDTGETHEVQV